MTTLFAWLHDVRLAARGIGRAKAFYATAVLTLAVGIAGATVMFTLIRGILLRPLPVPDEDRLVVSWRMPPTGLATHVPYRSSRHRDARPREPELRGGERRRLQRRVRPGVGRRRTRDQRGHGRGHGRLLRRRRGDARARPGLTEDDDRSGAEQTIVLSFAVWQRLFGGARDIVGRRLIARTHAYTIVGVMPADFEYPRGVEIWTTPHALAAGEADRSLSHRAAPGRRAVRAASSRRDPQPRRRAS